MDDWDVALILGCVGLLAALGILHTRWLAAHNDAIIAHDGELAFLRSALKTFDTERTGQ